jgi:hypothetical protein
LIDFERIDGKDNVSFWFSSNEIQNRLSIVDESQQMKIAPNTTFTLVQTYPDTSQMKTQYQSLGELLIFLLSNADKGLITKVRDEIIPGLIPENKTDDTSLIDSSQGRNLQRLYKKYLETPYSSVRQLFNREYDLASPELKAAIDHWMAMEHARDSNAESLKNRADAVIASPKFTER